MQISSQVEAKKAKADGDYMFLVLLEGIRADIVRLERSLEARYGQNFAEDLLSDLVENGLVNDEDRQRIGEIEDKAERRQAIAELIQGKMNRGEIKGADVKGHPWARDWLKVYEELDQKTKEVAVAAVKNNVDPALIEDSAVRKETEILLGKEGKNLDAVKAFSFEEIFSLSGDGGFSV